MKGFLYVEQDLKGYPNGTFTQRYFVTFPFCGLKWFDQEPTDVNLNNLFCLNDETCGWVFGSSLVPQSVEIQEQIRYHRETLYPFVVTVKYGESTTDVRFASKREDIRQLWVETLNQFVKTSNYVLSCTEKEVIPYDKVFNSMKDNKTDDCIIRDIKLNSRVINSLIQYFEFSSPHGLMLNSLILENVQLTDNHLALFSNIISMAGYIGEISIAENRITSKGIIALSKVLKTCKYLIKLNISNNSIDNKCAESLAKSLSSCNLLESINFSRNRFTGDAMDFFIKYLGFHDSKLQFVDFSYNELGDKVTEFIGFLLSNSPSHLKGFNLSFCDITDEGLKYLSSTIPLCSTLQYVILKGVFPLPPAMLSLIQGIGEHYKQQEQKMKSRGKTQQIEQQKGKNPTELQLVIGGIMQECDECNSLSLKTLKTSFPSIWDQGRLSQITLRRRLQSSHITFKDENLGGKSVGFASVGDHPVVCLRVKLPKHLDSPESFLNTLALHLGIDSNRFQLLSCSFSHVVEIQNNHFPNSSTSNGPQDSSGLCFIMFTVVQSASERQFHRHYLSYLNVLSPFTSGIVTNLKMARKEEAQSKKSILVRKNDFKARRVIQPEKYTVLEELFKSPDLCSVAEVLLKLENMVRTSHPLLRMLGVRTGFLQYPKDLLLSIFSHDAFQMFKRLEGFHRSSFFNFNLNQAANTALQEYENMVFKDPTTRLVTKDGRELVTCHLYVRPSGSGGRGLEDHLFYPVSPEDTTTVTIEESLPPQDTDDDEEFDQALRKRKTVLSALTEYSDVYHLRSLSNAVQAGKSLNYVQFLRMNGGSVLNDEDENNSVAQQDEKESGGDVGSDLYETSTAEENLTHSPLLNRRVLREQNERLVLAVRQLYSEGEVSSSVAKFWEGAFGHLKHKDIAVAGLKTALHPAAGIFRAVYYRLQLCDTMIRRDLVKMEQLLEGLLVDEKNPLNSSVEAVSPDSPNPTQNMVETGDKPTSVSKPPLMKLAGLQGGMAHIYSQRLLSELISLQRRFHDVKLIAKGYSQLNVVEEYLLACGKLGYSGPEMFQAVELRQRLVTKAAHAQDPRVLEDLPYIKQKALLSNLMISRDFVNLRKRLEDFTKDAVEDPKLMSTNESQAAGRMLEDFEVSKQQLQAAIVSKNIEQLDRALAFSSYHYLYSDFVPTAINCLNDISRQPARLLIPILNGLRVDDPKMVEIGLEQVYKMGFFHPGVDPLTCSKLAEKKFKILQDDSVKSKLIQACLALKNGFPVGAGEMNQLLRRAIKLELHLDPTMESYFTTLNKYMRQFSGLMKQEKAIQFMIDFNQVPRLKKILSGRGSGKLVMNAPSAHAREEWMQQLEACCKGKFVRSISNHEGKYNEQEVFFTGTLEKAARNDKGLVRGWRQRFFLLQTTTLTYFTKAHGEKKGMIRVIGGGVRVMEPSEAGGRQFCFELEEGRDISQIDPDLLDEARRLVQASEAKALEAELKKSIQIESLRDIQRILASAVEQKIILSVDLTNEARLMIDKLKERNLRRDLYFAAILVPKASLEELINLAEKININPKIKSFSLVKELALTSELNQFLLRIMGALTVKDEEIFRKTFIYVTRFDLNQFTTKQKFFLSALILQHSGFLALQYQMEGLGAAESARFLKHALSSCSQLLVETESMDLARLIVSMSKRYFTVNKSKSLLLSSLAEHGNSGITQSMGDTKVRTDQLSGLSMYVEDLTSFDPLNPQYEISKFNGLRVFSTYKQGGLNLTAAFQSKRKNQLLKSNEVLRFSPKLITKSLIKHEPPSSGNSKRGGLDAPDPNTFVEAFHILMVVMGDKPLNSLPRPRKFGILRSKAQSAVEIVLDLINFATKRFSHESHSNPVSSLKNELYFQIAKQLRNNPNPVEMQIYGWLLMTLYLHAFAPSAEAVPYLTHFVQSVKKGLSPELPGIGMHCSLNNGDVKEGGGTQFSEDQKALYRVVSYCAISLQNLNGNSANDMTGPGKKYGKDHYLGVYNNNLLITPAVVKTVFEQEPLEIDIVVMTGTTFRLSIPFGQCSTSYSLLELLYDCLFPDDEFYHEFSHHSVQEGGGFSGSLGLQEGEEYLLNSGFKAGAYSSLQMKSHRIKTLFRGFGLYSVSVNEMVEFDDNDETNTIRTNHVEVNLQRVPVQPVLSQRVPWTHDLQWDLIAFHCKPKELKQSFEGSEIPESENSWENYNEIRDSNGFLPHNTLVLRRTTAMLSESGGPGHLNCFEIFGSEVPEGDVSALHTQWMTWLSKPDNPLPPDYVRVDLNFAEDSRLVNSQLYPVGTDAFMYLLSIQITLCWVNDDPLDWGIQVEDVEKDAEKSRESNHNTYQKFVSDKYVLFGTNASVRPSYKNPFNLHNLHAKTLEASQEEDHETQTVNDQSSIGNVTLNSKTIELIKQRQEEKKKAESESESDDETEMREAEIIALEEKRKADLERGFLLDGVDGASVVGSQESESSSEYVSSIDDEEDEDVMLERIRRMFRPILSREEINEHDEGKLSRLLDQLGVSRESVSNDKIFELMIEFHILAKKANVTLTSPKFRYLLKRSYIEYLQSICPFYGFHFSEATLLQHQFHGEGNNTGLTGEDEGELDFGQGEFKIDSKIRSSLTSEATIINSEVLVAVSTNGVIFLEPRGWTVHFFTPLWDILECSIIPIEKLGLNQGELQKRGCNGDEELLLLNVNDLELLLMGDNISEIQEIIDICCRESLGRGHFPFGSEGGEGFLQSLQGNGSGYRTYNMTAKNLKPNSNMIEASITPLIDAKSLLQKFLSSYPILPRPPVPKSAVFLHLGAALEKEEQKRGKNKTFSFIPTPPSRREKLAAERLEEERIETEMARLAAEAQTEKNQRQMQQGREDMKKYRKASSGVEDDDDDDYEGKPGLSTATTKKEGRKSRRRNNRSVFARNLNSAEVREQMALERLSAVACGVSSRASRFTSFEVPTTIPTKIGGTIKLNPQERRKVPYRPEIEDHPNLYSKGEEVVMKPVSLNWRVQMLNPEDDATAGFNAIAAAAAAATAAVLEKELQNQSEEEEELEMMERKEKTVDEKVKEEQRLLADANERLQATILDHSTTRWSHYQQRKQETEKMKRFEAKRVTEHTINELQQRQKELVAQRQIDSGLDSEEVDVSRIRAPKDPYLFGISAYLKKKKKRPGAVPTKDSGMEDEGISGNELSHKVE